MSGREYTPTNLGREAEVADRRINIGYGYILAAISTETEPRYLALIEKEGSIGNPRSEPVAVPIEESYEHLAATYGPPENLVGFRVRVEYLGHNWMSGVAKIVPSADIRPRRGLLDVPERGFRYAAAGGTSR